MISSSPHEDQTPAPIEAATASRPPRGRSGKIRTMPPATRRNTGRAADEKLLNFRLPPTEARQLELDLTHASLSRQTVVTAILAEWQAGRIVVEADGTVRYPETERLAAEMERQAAESEDSDHA